MCLFPPMWTSQVSSELLQTPQAPGKLQTLSLHPLSVLSPPSRLVRFKMLSSLSLMGEDLGNCPQSGSSQAGDLCFTGAWGSICLQQGVYRGASCSASPAAVGQSGAMLSGGEGERNAWRISGDSSNIPRGCLSKGTLEEVKEDVEFRLLNWEKTKYY